LFAINGQIGPLLVEKIMTFRLIIYYPNLRKPTIFLEIKYDSSSFMSLKLYTTVTLNDRSVLYDHKGGIWMSELQAKIGGGLFAVCGGYIAKRRAGR
jgi:hypothetical protein